ncbi:MULTISPECIES: hypothetical protein [Treponema]|uniref:Lipoprotein n=1 Tax=Treponema denticola (strain ATCC 35405 / DSM 14222 / CIP 103919 / JCM 8153 / KCTC 15104) TaxID=243275 RepID=Q73M18_TREDE|nr:MULTISPECIES: hypothetical protein [Treponema]AAS12208.1 hypothetical protein TDE_1693 [Treponema denticola ATCC 35405]EMB37766.1 hypothetical protein HMPREF9735_01360 [Treponema denticola ATCC 33521]EMB40380.1 hypothetical protein HMPREF9721_00474 [Treponema denticola ATCC 35404]HCY94663.1 hypothetical protein [Treponema sp.]
MKKLSFTVAAAAVVVGMVLLCTACQFDGQKIVDQFLLGSYGTYSWNSDNTKLTIKSNENNFQKHFAGLGKNSVTLKKETVGAAKYLTSPEYYLDAKSMDGDVWQGIFYLNGYGFRTIKITLKSGGRCEIQPGLSVEEGIKFPEDLTITGSLESNAGKILPKAPSTTGMPTYTKQFFAAVKSDSLKTKWVDDNEVETFTYYRKDQENMMVTETWKGSPQLFVKGTDAGVYYKRILKYDNTNTFVSGTFEIFIPKGTALPAVFP